jgi:beta-glucosidase
LSDEYSDTLVKNVAGNCSNTIVVIHNAGPRLVDEWIELTNVTAVIFAHTPGQASGKALVSLLYGKDNFSGRLPYTVAKQASDYGDMATPCQPEGEFELYPQCNFTEKLLVDYRRFDYEKIDPRFEFGFGMSYTTFEYSGLKVQKAMARNLTTYPTGPILEGGQTDLWDELVTVTATVTNTGSVAGDEVAQLYISVPGAGQNGTPVKQLRGFDKPSIPAGQSTEVTFKLTRRDLSEWDVVSQKWMLLKGAYQVMVGSSSRTLPLTSSFTLWHS